MFIQTELKSWGQSAKGRCRLYRPERRQDLPELLQRGGEPHLIARGEGRSYGDAAINSAGAVVHFGRLNRFLAFNAESGLLKCEPGVTFDDLLRTFVPRGWFPPVTPGTKFVSLGGAVAADIHGKNHHRDGSISRHIESLELLSAAGETLHCSHRHNPDVFWASIGGMGLTGFITAVELKLRPVQSSDLDVTTFRGEDLDSMLDLFDRHDRDYQYSVAWLDCLAKGASLGRGLAIFGNHSQTGVLRVSRKRSLSLPIDLPNFTLTAAAMRAFNQLYFHRHPKRERRSRLNYDSFFYPLDGLHNWDRIYGSRGFLQYQCVFPREEGRQPLVRLLEKVGEYPADPFLAVLKRFGEQEGLLSFPMPGYTLALDFPHSGDELQHLLHELDKLVLDHGGRVYLAKDARLSGSRFSQMYPQLPRWLSAKSAIDPNNLFSSDLYRRLCESC
ncbi:MAG: FAD-binding protein [Acidobacteriota bacterium]